MSVFIIFMMIFGFGLVELGKFIFDKILNLIVVFFLVKFKCNVIFKIKMLILLMGLIFKIIDFIFKLIDFILIKFVILMKGFCS